jgi:DNA ligase (NAD+)
METKMNEFEGMTFVVTGTIEGFTRKELSAFIEKLGGKVSSSVSKKTDFLLVGNEPGEVKIEKALELGVKIIDEDKFTYMWV